MSKPVNLQTAQVEVLERALYHGCFQLWDGLGNEIVETSTANEKLRQRVQNAVNEHDALTLVALRAKCFLDNQTHSNCELLDAALNDLGSLMNRNVTHDHATKEKGKE